MNHKEYNGWTNYETWAVKLWLDNEEPSYRYWSEIAQETFQDAVNKHQSYFTASEQARYNLADRLKDAHEEAKENILRREAQSSVWADLLGAALSEVNWAEIANALLEECESRDGEKYEYANEL